MNRQSIFDRAARHLFYQNQQAAVPGQGKQKVRCLYLITEGLKTGCRCAIGGLLPPEIPAEKLDGTASEILYSRSASGGWADEIRAFFEISSDGVMPSPNTDFLNALQAVHDSNPVTCWPEELYQLANTYDLSISVLYEFPWVAARLERQGLHA